MDVTTLPKEMMANILRYSQFEDVHKMRTLNTFVDATVNQYSDLKRMPIIDFGYKEFTDSNGKKQWSVILSLEESVLKCYNLFDRISRGKLFPSFHAYGFWVAFQFRTMATRMETMIEYASKVKLRGTLSLKVSVLDDNFFQITDKIKKIFKHCTARDFSDVHSTVSKKTMKRFIDMLPNLKRIDYFKMRSEIYGSEMLFNTEVLGKRNWERIHFYSMGELDFQAYLDDQFLMEVAPNCQFLEILCCRDTTSFSFQGVINMTKEILSGGVWKQNISLGTIQLGDIRLSDVGRMLKTFKEAEYTCMHEERGDGWKANYKLTFDDSEHLYFEIDIPQDVD